MVNSFVVAPVSRFLSPRAARFPLATRLGVISVTVFAMIAGGLAVPAVAVDPCSPLVSAIVCENSKAGVPWSVWDVEGAGDPAIQGFATDMSVNAGQQIGFKVKSANAFTIDIYRLGWYNGDGARLQTSVTPTAGVSNNQPSCVDDANGTQIYDCGTWGVSASWNVPAAAVSGVYIAKLTRSDSTHGASHIPFVVRNDASTSALFFQTSDTTWQAYNAYGGSDFYVGGVHGRAYKLSYNRPFATRGDNNGRDYLFSNEYPMIRFLERNGYDVSYTTGLDSDRRGNLIKNHKAFLSVGHDEYWSGQQRANVESARDAGVSLAFFSGNEVYWKTRLEPSQDGTNTANRTLVCYKETWANGKLDATSTEWSGTWRDPRFSPPSNGGRPENALTGQQYMVNSDDLALTIPYAQGKYRFWRNTSVANLALGQTATLAPHTIGYESDEDVDNGFRPAGLMHLSTTSANVLDYLQDFGNTTAPGPTTHHLTLYRASSGALVFAAGTIQWAWGLDDEHDGIESPADPDMQQATINLFADMGVQPVTLMAGMDPASASTDTQAPTIAITSPAANASFSNGSLVTVQGTATEVGGGKVTAIEVSTNGGTIWHPATGTTSWSYTFASSGASSQVILARAGDDSGNVTSTPASRQVTLTGSHSIFGATVPTTPAVGDGQSAELGVRFTPQTNGLITGVRFYKGTGNTGTHTGKLWTAEGSLLASGTFSGETSSGWQTMTFSSPVSVGAGGSYVVSYYAPNGHYAVKPFEFSYRDYNSAPLLANRSLGANTNGLFRYGSGFPQSSYNDTNYFVDVTFVASEDAAPIVISKSPLANATGVAVSTQVSAVFSKALDPASVQFTLKDEANLTVAGASAYNNATKTVTFTPSANLATAKTFTATVNANDTLGHPMDAPVSWSFTTDLDASVAKLFATNAIPATVAADDGAAVELGVRFTPSVNGTMIGVRYYQGPGNTGTHTGSLWTSTGTLLATVIFASGTGSGWQNASFEAPVAVTAGTTYVVSYFAPNGHYAADGSFFTSPWSNGPLTAPGSNNGLFKYGGGFPTDTWQATNYWVDPLFNPGGTVPTPPPTPGGPLTIFTSADTPVSASWNDGNSIEAGVKFTSDVAGNVTGVRFYKGAGNTGTHTGSLWTSTGTLLATATFTSETGTGWQTVTFSSPVHINAATVYVASYHANVGHYAVSPNALASGLHRAPLHVQTVGGAYYYGTGFPSNAVNHNYWVDVTFTPDS
jgi:hypothetical protein